MERLVVHIEFVKSQLEFQQRQAIKFAAERRRAELHSVTAARFEALLNDLIWLQNFLESNPNALTPRVSSLPRLSLSWDEIEGLPPELLEELSISESDKLEFTISSIITELGGVVSLDRLIVALFKKTGEINKRGPLNQRLYRMAQKDLIYSVPGKKGIYSNRPISEDEAIRLQ